MNAIAPSEIVLAYRLLQQSLLAEFGLFALRTNTFDELLQRATELCADGMNAQFAKVLEHQPDERRFLVRAGVGWAPGVVGAATVGADLESPAGYALKTGRSVISNHLTDESRFRTPKLLAEHGVRRAINVIIRSSEHSDPFGVLEVDSTSSGVFEEADLAFMQGFANLLGVAIERRRAEDALREGEEQTRLIIEGARDYAILTMSPAGVVTGWCEGAQAIFGWSEAEIVGRNAAVLFTPDDRRAGVPAQELTEARERGCAEDERWHIRKDGGLFYASGSVRPLHDAEGRLRGFVKIAKDDTERRRQSEAKRQAEERWRLAIEAADVGTWDYDPVTGELHWDERCKALFGVPAAAQVTYDTFLAGLHPDDRERTDAAVRWALDPDGSGIYDVEYRTIGPADDVERWVAAKGRAAFEGEGESRRAVRFIGTVLDITERKRAEEVNARLAAIVSSTNDAIISFAATDGRIMTWNKGAETLFGYTEAEAVGAPVNLLLPPNQPEGPTGVFAATLQGGKIEAETVRVHKSGERIDVSIAASRMQAADGRILGVSGIFRDIRERKRGEVLMREAVEHQETMTREVSHRVKNSLALVASLLGLQARATKQDEVRRALLDAEARVGTIAEVHDQLWRRGEVSTVDLVDFLDRLCAKLQETAPQHRLVFEGIGPLTMATERAIPVGLLLNELVTNAFKYAYPASAGEVRVSLHAPEPGQVRLEVADRGQGLPAGFDLTRPTSSLGARLISGFVRQLGAGLEVESAEPGVRFVMRMAVD